MRTATIYNFLIEANLMAAMAILLMAVMRKFFRKPLGSRALCFGWLMVALRLLLPISLHNPYISQIRPAMMRDATVRPIAGQILVRSRDALDTLYVYSRYTLGVPKENLLIQGMKSAYNGMWNGKLAGLLMLVYLAGVLLVLGYFLYKNLRFAGEMKKNRIEPLCGEMLENYHALCRRMQVKPLPVYLTDPLQSACLAGTVRPYIALPVTVKPEEMMLVLEHEMWHYKQKDHLWAGIRLLCCMVHWFHPLVWLAASWSRTDMEMRCDERVMKNKTPEEKKAYATLLVATAARRTAPGLPVLATGMTMTGKRLKERVKQVISERKTVAVLAGVFCVAAVVLLMGAFSTSEFIGEPRIPAFRANMLPPVRPVTTEEEAILLAEEVAALPQVNAKLKNGEWMLITEGDKPGVKVAAWRANGKNTFIVRMYEDGGLYGFGDYTVGYHSDERREFYGKPVWDEELMDFVEGWMLAMNPQLEGKINEKMFVGHFIQDGERYAQVQIGVDIEGYGYIGATVKLNPTFQIVEIGPGNG